MKRLAAIAACLVIAACTTTNVRLANDLGKPPPASSVLALQPDVVLSELTAVGLAQPRADWSKSAQDNLASALKTWLDGKGLKYATLDPASVSDAHDAQLLRLNNAVSSSILLYNMNLASLPTHKGGFNWTLGDGAKSLGEDYKSDYVLYVFARGSYSTSGRVLVSLAFAAAGVALPMGGQTVVVSLADLKTGRVIWYNLAQASPDADMRSPQGAQALMGDVMKSAPF